MNENELTKKDKLIILNNLYYIKFYIHKFNYDIELDANLTILNLYNVISNDSLINILKDRNILIEKKVDIIETIINNINFI